MLTDIPQTRWQNFCQSFSMQHDGWLVRMGVIDTRLLEQDPTAQADALAINLPLQGITLEQQEDILTISLGDQSSRLTHRIQQPSRLYFERINGAQPGLRIDATDGRTTLLRFRVAA
jgi:hypothetical protein